LNHIRNTILRFLEEGSLNLPINTQGDLRTFTMKELGISHPILAANGGEPKPVRVPNPDVQGAAASVVAGSEMYGAGGGEGYAAPGGGFGAPMAAGAPVGGPAGAAAKDDAEVVPAFFDVKETTFTIQFCWTPKTLSERLAAQEEAARLKAAADAEAAANAPPVTANDAATENAAPAGAAPAVAPEGAAPAEAAPVNQVPAGVAEPPAGAAGPPAGAAGPPAGAAEPVGAVEAGT
jgi:hypothetical protein